MAKHKPTVIRVEFNGTIVEQRRKDGYLNATGLSAAYQNRSGKRREVSSWLANKRTKEMLEHLSRNTGIPVNELYQVFQGAPEAGGGTWIHPKLATRFGAWLDDDFGLWVEDLVSTWMLSDREIPREQILEYLFPDEHGVHVIRFRKEFRDRFEVVMKVRWDSPAAMGFISRTIYKPLMAEDARSRMNAINPQREDGRRCRKIVQHTAPEFDEKVQERIKVIQILLNVSRGKQSFWTNYNAQFGADVQGGFDLAELL